MPDLSNRVHEASNVFTAKFKQSMDNTHPNYPLISTVVESNSSAVDYGFLSDFPTLKEWVGARQLKQLVDFQYSITNKLFESSTKVKRTDFEDNDYGKYAAIFEEMGRLAIEFPDEIVFQLLKDGTTKTCFDGKPFFSAVHPVGSNTVSNYFTPDSNPVEPWYLLDTSRGLKPLIWQERVKASLESVFSDGGSFVDPHVFMNDEFLFGVRARGNAGYGLWQMAACSTKPLNAANFEEVYDALLSVKNEEGKSMKVRPTLLVIPVAHRAAAMGLIERQVLQNGESNSNYKIVDILVAQDL